MSTDEDTHSHAYIHIAGQKECDLSFSIYFLPQQYQLLFNPEMHGKFPKGKNLIITVFTFSGGYFKNQNSK